MQRKTISFLIATLILLSVACGLGYTPVDPSIALTLTPLYDSVRATVTARAEAEGGSSDELATAVSKATERAQIIYATQTARAELNEPSRLATATAIAPVVAELPRYGIDPGQGYVAWLHNPATIELNGYQQTGYVNDYPQITASNFVMAADITWNTQNSLSGCGFMFRSNGDTNKPSQYMVIVTRVASGHMVFLAMVDGDISNFREYFPKDEDKSFNWFNDATNRLAIVARGNNIDLYTNGVLIGKIDITQPPPDVIVKFPKMEIPEGITPEQYQQYEEQVREYDKNIKQITDQLGQARVNFGKKDAIFYDGLLGFLGISQTGHMTCKFDNAWMFVLTP